MVQGRIPEREAIVDVEQIEEYIQLSEKLMGYVYRDVVDQAMKLAPLHGRVLDVGTGFGMLAITLAQRNPTVEVIGLDVSATMIEAGKRVIGRKGLVPRVSFEMADARAMPFPDNYFDGVISYGSLHHWLEPEAVFNEINRVRGPGGMIYIADLRRDQPRIPLWFLYAIVGLRAGKRMADEMVGSVNAAYTPSEIGSILGKTNITHWQPMHSFYGINLFSSQK
jgi:ubiquinone/menaquinone biosynthesis C-methylase UbiE